MFKNELFKSLGPQNNISNLTLSPMLHENNSQLG
jgi:hypothetical protein